MQSRHEDDLSPAKVDRWGKPVERRKIFFFNTNTDIYRKTASKLDFVLNVDRLVGILAYTERTESDQLTRTNYAVRSLAGSTDRKLRVRCSQMAAAERIE